MLLKRKRPKSIKVTRKTLNNLLKLKRQKPNSWLKSTTVNIFNRIQKPIKRKTLNNLLKSKSKAFIIWLNRQKPLNIKLQLKFKKPFTLKLKLKHKIFILKFKQKSKNFIRRLKRQKISGWLKQNRLKFGKWLTRKKFIIRFQKRKQPINRFNDSNSSAFKSSGNKWFKIYTRNNN
jgi:hypothetical protein